MGGLHSSTKPRERGWGRRYPRTWQVRQPVHGASRLRVARPSTAGRRRRERLTGSPLAAYDTRFPERTAPCTRHPRREWRGQATFATCRREAEEETPRRLRRGAVPGLARDRVVRLGPGRLGG